MAAKVTKSMAEELAPHIGRLGFEDARDAIDLATAGDLDPTQLDLLTDWVIEARDRRVGAIRSN